MAMLNNQRVNIRLDGRDPNMIQNEQFRGVGLELWPHTYPFAAAASWSCPLVVEQNLQVFACLPVSLTDKYVKHPWVLVDNICRSSAL